MKRATRREMQLPRWQDEMLVLWERYCLARTELPRRRLAYIELRKSLHMWALVNDCEREAERIGPRRMLWWIRREGYEVERWGSGMMIEGVKWCTDVKTGRPVIDLLVAAARQAGRM